MNVLHLSSFDINGGAARAAYRLHQGLLNKNVTSRMLVLEKYSRDNSILEPRTKLSQGIARAKITFDALPLKLYRQQKNTLLSLQWLPDTVAHKVRKLNPDIINLHWISGGFMQIETLAKLNRPLVFTLHDMWAFTGGCHYSGNCDRYTASCGFCPELDSNHQCDLSHWVWRRKAKAWRKLNLTIVAISSWIAKCASSSSLFKDLRIEIIPNGLNTNTYRPLNKEAARQLLGLPKDKRLVLFGALNATSDHRKGFHLLQSALQNLSRSRWRDMIELAVFGSSQPNNPIDQGLKARYLGQLNDDISLACVYSAADVMVVPSIQEAFGQTASEALACATPVVAFNSTGLIDIVEHQRNGYLAKPFEVDDLAQGIAWVLENEERYQKLSHYARHKAEQQFTLETQASRYLALFNEIKL
ncbi:glycosyltransferase family 4 protein [Aetokthonos hydrillicola Thurmond2011]|jgi:glycosyltransferase involved in cell wall biosynthesis|uniref:Glycosyltransferase family 4 protein n=1 Tax=Aetokthonos hydrillicola Thurmond2011 TaxID=2712845 RepID=A0AAP5I601_9CYAN|nr:glycosyltransferase family 4 protein [Aetokthonos hydrillicola]MBO3460959.1 glycosyltransferase [Aetokthonos hydrillicola CCALA 1050]MBW4583632.1 glycosyltransferase family 4 protein [Aetokthonos hydrillicola CCALA 1050]MDR9895673.1 glycosyltransferase family 4 protein [Aetokthonos hydrillicola Thurmond2011]